MNQLPTTLPTIKLALGDDMETIQRQSSYRFPSRALGRVDMIGAGEPVLFAYARAECEFELPPSRSFGAAVNDGHAVSVTVSPQLNYVSLGAAFDLIKHLQQILEHGRWSLAKRYFTVDGARSRFEDSAQDSELTIRVEDWRCGDDELYIELQRHWRKGEGLAQQAGRDHDLCLVSLKIENDGVRAKYRGW